MLPTYKLNMEVDLRKILIFLREQFTLKLLTANDVVKAASLFRELHFSRDAPYDKIDYEFLHNVVVVVVIQCAHKTQSTNHNFNLWSFNLAISLHCQIKNHW